MEERFTHSKSLSKKIMADEKVRVWKSPRDGKVLEEKIVSDKMFETKSFGGGKFESFGRGKVRVSEKF